MLQLFCYIQFSLFTSKKPFKFLPKNEKRKIINCINIKESKRTKKGGMKVKKIIIVSLVLMSVFSISAKKTKKEPEMPDIQTQMDRAEKINSYKAKKDVAWHKTEYNKVLKYLNKKR